MARKSPTNPETRRHLVLRLLRHEDTCATLARTCRVTDQTLYRWRKQVLAEEPWLASTEARNDSPTAPARAAGGLVQEYLLDSFLRNCPVCGHPITADYITPRTLSSFGRHTSRRSLESIGIAIHGSSAHRCSDGR